MRRLGHREVKLTQGCIANKIQKQDLNNLDLCYSIHSSIQTLANQFYHEWQYNSSNLTLRYLPQRNANLCAHKHLYMNFYSSSTYNHPKLETTQTWYIHRMEYYSIIKRNKLLIHTTWINLKSIMLSEKSKTKKITYSLTPFM